LHVITQAPEAMCGQSVLAAATLACQPHADVRLPSGTKPLTGFFVTIAESGERKSTVDRLALQPVHDREHELRQAADAEGEIYAAEKTAWDAMRKEAEKLAKKTDGGREAVRQALLDLGPEPRPPASPMVLVSDPTPEGLTLHLVHRPWAGLFTAEGGTLIGGHAFNDESRMRTGALFNALWDGEPIRRRRAGTGSTFLPGRRCAMHLMMQGVVADRLLSDAMLEGLGLLARMLPCAPPSTAGTRMYRKPTRDAMQAHTDYCQRMGGLLRLQPPMDGDALKPDAMELSPEAKAMWIKFHDHAEAQLGDGGAYRTIRGFGAKLAEHAGRLAGVLAFYELGGGEMPPEVQAHHMAGGIELAQHYASEMLRLIGGAAVSAELQTAQAVLDWLKSQGRVKFHLAEIYQFGPTSVRNAAAGRAAMAVLVDHGQAVKLAEGSIVEGAGRREAWTVVS
jgi:hypothetical protein